ncbi:MAG: vitamin B12 dependent-methionine synthase activation domain-containing protein, partial [Chloroflexota bacterium]
IIEKAVEVNADAIGLSALLVSTSKQMPLVVNELARRGLEIPVLVGGAAINRKFGRRILFLNETGEPYTPGVFYCKDAFEGLAVVDKLMDTTQRDGFLQNVIEEAYAELDKKRPKRASRVDGKTSVVPLSADDVPTPPFWGPKVIEEMPLEIVFKYIHKPELFRLSWGAKNTRGDEWTKLEAEFEARLADMQKVAMSDGSLVPQATYGYFPANSDGTDLIIWDWQKYAETGEKVEAGRFSFPRQPNGEFLCISDYYASVDSGLTDVVTLQAVTVGEPATERFEELQSADEYSEAYFFHGLAVQTAEAVANYMTRHVARELGVPGKRGKRYSWGYPACPDLEDHTLVFDLLPGTAEIGLSLSPSYQLIPEQSTAAIYAHHPDAKYFGVGVDRTEQLLAE